jgi:hypothetical protein
VADDASVISLWHYGDQARHGLLMCC